MGLGLLGAAGPRNDGAGFGQRLQEGLGYVQAQKDAAMKRRFIQSQADENAAQAQQIQGKMAEAERIRGLVAGFGRMPQGMGATGQVNDALPADLRMGAQPPLAAPPRDYEALMRQGVPFELVKQLAESQNLGRPEVARTMKGIGKDGREYETQFDKFGLPVGEGQAQYRAPISINQGNRTTLADAYNFKPVADFKTFQSPDNQASVGASYANAAATRSVAASNVKAANIQRDQATEMKLGDDWRNQSKDFKSVTDAYSQINATLGSATTSPAATLAAATKFMKMLDPGSVVRESELGMALNSSGVFDRASNYFSTLQSGKKLTETQVADFKNITKQIYGAAQGVQRQVDANYKTQAETYGLRPEVIIQNLGQNDKAGKPLPPSPSAANLTKGERYTLPNGQEAEWDGMRFKGK
jgi:hypothetical protein